MSTCGVTGVAHLMADHEPAAVPVGDERRAIERVARWVERARLAGEGGVTTDPFHRFDAFVDGPVLNVSDLEIVLAAPTGSVLRDQLDAALREREIALDALRLACLDGWADGRGAMQGYLDKATTAFTRPIAPLLAAVEGEQT